MKKRSTGSPGIDALDGVWDRVKESMEYARSLKGCQYADIRLGLTEYKSAGSENGSAKGMEQEVKISFGVRLVAGEMSAWGFYGQPLGEVDLKVLRKRLRVGINKAHQRALANSRNKAAMRDLAPSLAPVRLASVEVGHDVVPADFEEDPRDVPLKDVLGLAVDITAQMRAVSPGVRFASIGLATGLTRELFHNTEGACIDQSYALTWERLYVVAQEGTAVPETFVDHLGAHGGWEVAGGKNVYGGSFMDFALERTRDTVELAAADFLPSSDEPVVVVTDPHFNALLVHEVIGHPTEADRALKMETAYAGRSWLLRNLSDNQLGKRVGSELLTAFSDPALGGYGHFKYDTEGVPAKRVTLIDKGILKGFMNSRETAALMGAEPNGSMRASEPQYMPLVRMTNTVVAPGDRDPEEIIAEVKDGYYVVNNRIPSISESRENFRISAQKVYKIENGRLTKLFRGGGISADSRDFFMNIDAVGNDFKMFPIPNCGKGQPMQVMRVGNGGPTLRSKARLTGEYK